MPMDSLDSLPEILEKRAKSCDKNDKKEGE